MTHNPLAKICIFFCLGIWIAKFVYIPLFFVYISCVLFLVTALVSLQRQFLFFLSLGLAVFLAGFIHLQNAQTYPVNHIANFVSGSPQKAYLRGKVVTSPEVSQTFYHSKKSTFTFQVYDLKLEETWHAVQGLIKVTAYGARKVEYGDELLLQGTLALPPGLRNPGGFNYRDYLANHNVFALLQVKEKDALHKKGSGAFLISKIFKFKQKLRKLIFANLEGHEANLLSAILLGERSGLPQDIKDQFIKTGTIHILAISGLHVGLIAFILVSLFRFLRFNRKLTFILTIFVLIAYAALSGARPSVVRATIMAVIVLFGLLLNREIRIYNSLGLAALIILISNPRHLFDSGFQLSFLSVISIVCFTPKIEKLFPVASNRFLLYLIKAFSVSLAAWIGIAPLTAYYFNIVTPVAVLANLVVIPFLFLVVSVGISFLIFAYLWLPLGAVFGQSCWLSLVGLTRMTMFISKIPLGFFHCPQPGILFFCAYYALLLLVFNYKKLNISSGKIAIILAIVANVLIWRPVFEGFPDRLRVTFLDVGQGDAMFIEFPYSYDTMLIDGGPAGASDAGRRIILPFLWNKGINKINLVVLTHPDNDHVGGLASVLKNIKVNYVFDNGMPKDSISYNDYRAALTNRVKHYQRIKREEKISGFPQVSLFVINPPEPLLTATTADTNNNSVVLKIVYKDISFLFCGDIEEEAMQKLLPYAPILKSTVLKVPHHGSDEKEAEDRLLKAVSPQVAVISVGSNNRFGLPAKEVVESLKYLGAKVYKTGDSGAITVSTDGRKIWVKTMVK